MYIDYLPVMHRGVKSTADGFDSYYFHINPGIYFPTEKEMKNSCLGKNKKRGKEKGKN